MIEFFRNKYGFSLPQAAAVLALVAVLGVVGAVVYGRYQDSQSQPQFPEVTDNNNVNQQPELQDQEQAQNEPKPQPQNPTQVMLDVPFTSQAPFGDWDDPRQQDACEESSVLMAMLWVRGQTSISRDEALNEILAMSDWENEKYGSYHDTSGEDTITRLFNDYYNYDKVSLRTDVTIENIKKELAEGRLVLVPANGQALNNPNFTGAGPERHMLVIRGYDDRRGQFITNDPGTRRGEEYKYSYNVLIDAIRDYPTGYKVPIEGVNKAIIVVER